jgi:leucyl-tRNA synthetase
MWAGLGHEGGVLRSGARWPQADEELARKEELEIPIQINGRLRARIRAVPDTPEAELRAAALADEKARAYTAGREIVKVIVVPNRLVNIVVR